MKFRPFLIASLFIFTLKTSATRCPSIDFPNLTSDANDDAGCSFSYSTSDYDLSVISSALPPQTKAGEALPITGTVKNVGAQTVTEFDMNFSIDGRPAQTQHVSGVNLQSNATYDFKFTKSWTPAEAGKFSAVKIWASNLNGGATDGNPANDTLTASVFTVLGVTVGRRVLIEEFTGAWCGWCPDGLLQMEEIAKTYPETVMYSAHAGTSPDGMKTVVGTDLATAFTAAYPTALIDRIRYADQKGVPVQRDNDAWLARIPDRKNAGSPLTLSVDVKYDATKQTATITPRAEFFDYSYPGDIRLNVFIIEDHVSGTGSGYDQTNFYSGNSSFPNHPFYGLPNPIPGFDHRHVLRGSVTGTWGDATVIPSAPQANEVYTQAYAYTVPKSFKVNDMSVVAFVSYFDANIEKRIVLNAAAAPLVQNTSAADSPEKAGTFQLANYPNPFTKKTTIRFTLTSDRSQTLTPALSQGEREKSTSLKVYDALGREVATLYNDFAASGSHELIFDASALPAGIYFAVLRQAAVLKTIPILLSK